jgi:hypothetical protein
MSPDQPGPPALTPVQAYEAAYRFVAQYYERERIVPFMLMLTAMPPTADRERTNDPVAWRDWLNCVNETLAGTRSRNSPPPGNSPGADLPPSDDAVRLPSKG